MNVRKISILLIVLTIFISIFFLYSIPPTKANGQIPDNYNQNLDLNDSYVYNVTEFDSKFSWFDYWTYIGDFETNAGGQIIVNFTGFYDKSPNDSNILFDPVPYVNITFMKNISNSLVLNNTVSNVSSSSAAYALAMSYNDFRPGFLIPIDDFNSLIQQAYDQDETGFWEANVIVREFIKMIEFEFRKDDNSQNTTIIYDRQTGILVYSKVQSAYGPDFEIFLEGYQMEFRPFNNKYSQQLDYDDSFIYNVTEFDSKFSWFDYWTYIGDVETNPGGQIIVNFTGFYDKSPNDGNVLSDPVPYINISFMKNISNSLVLNNTVSNVSSSSASYALAMSYNDFRPGFLIPVNDFDLLSQLAYSQNEPGGFWEATVIVRKYIKMIEFEFKKADNSQNTTVIYDRQTGILVYSKVQSAYGPDFEIYLDGYQQDFTSFNSMYSQLLNFSRTYIYNVSMFDSKFSWYDYWTYIGDFETNPGGQIKVNFTGFYGKNSNDGNVLYDPVPYINITFMKNISNSLVLNSTVSNISSSSAAYALAMTYNDFRPGFLIPTGFINQLKQQALDQDQSGFWEAEILIEELEYLINFTFIKADNSQNTTIIYDKSTGILVYSKVQSAYGPDFIINLTSYDFNFQSMEEETVDNTNWVDLLTYYGSVDNGETIIVGTYSVNSDNPFSKISLELANAHWQLSIIIKDEDGETIDPIETGTNGQNMIWAVYIVLDTHFITIEIKASFSPMTSSGSSGSGVNYFLQAVSSESYKDYDPYQDIKDKSEDKPFTVPFLLIIGVSIAMLLCLIVVLKLTFKKSRDY